MSISLAKISSSNRTFGNKRGDLCILVQRMLFTVHELGAIKEEWLLVSYSWFAELLQPMQCQNWHLFHFKITFSDALLLGFFLCLLISLFSTSSQHQLITPFICINLSAACRLLLGLPHQVQALNSYLFFKSVIAFSFTLSFLLLLMSIRFWSTVS